MQPSTEPVKLNVPFRDKDLAKAAGAQWDKEAKAWFAPPGAEMSEFTAWIERRRDPKPVDLDKMAFVLDVPFERKEEAKAAGANWDSARKVWFAPKGKEEALEAFKVERQVSARGDGDPVREFANALREAGLDVDHPIMDGKIHRAPLIDGKRHSKDGAYSGHDDGVPRGFIQNHKTGLKMTWRCGSAHCAPMSPSHRAAWSTKMELSRHQRERESEAGYEAAAAEAKARWDSMPQGPGAHPYAQRKDVGLYGVKVAGDSLVIPARDIEGKLWTLQTIPADRESKKLFMKGGRKVGCFHMIGEITPGSDILVAEGYATAATLHEATGLPVAVAFDAGNLQPVGAALAAKHPTSLVAFMADNDRYGATNTGVEKALAAAHAVEGAMVAPQFPTDQGRPTDWNDMALAQGHQAVRAQVSQGLALERQRLRQACLEKIARLRPNAKPYVIDWRDGRDFGVALPMPGGFVAVMGGSTHLVLHEARRLGATIESGSRVSISYKNGRGQVVILAQRKTPQVFQQQQ